MQKIYFVSNRDVKHESSAKGDLFGTRHNADGAQCFRVGMAEVHPGDGAAADPESWSLGKAMLFPEKLDSRNNGELLGSSKMFETLRAELKSVDKDVVIFLHGFNNDFQDSIRLTAALQSIYSTPDQPLMFIPFSWPSDGNIHPYWSYVSDREDAEASALAIGRALMRLVEFLTELRNDDRKPILAARRAGRAPEKTDLKQCTRRLHLMAHSMGNWALRHAVQKFLNLNGGKAARVLDSVFMMAADDDNDTFEYDLKLRRLDEIANRIFVYHANNDVVLTIADTTKGLPHRLGSDGPRNMAMVGERIHAIDCSAISSSGDVDGRHQYYRKSDVVIQDIIATMQDLAQDNRPWREAKHSPRSWRLPPQPPKA